MVAKDLNMRYVALLLLALSSNSLADPMEQLRCRNDLINRGASMDLVRSKCGEPASKAKSTKLYVNEVPGVITPIQVEVWTYKWAGQMEINAIFNDGALVDIEETNDRVH